MGQTLTHGIYLPDEGERNCYNGLAGNWQLLDGAVGTIAEHTSALAGKAASNHVHGNLTNDGKVGTAANKPLITGTGGVVQAGSFGNAANTFCEGNDSRLSDARTPVAHTHGKADVTDLFNSANTWSANNTYSANCIIYNSDNSGSVPGLKLRNSKAEILSTGNTSSDQSITFRDKNDVALGYVRGAVQSSSVAVKIGAYAKDSSNNTVNTELQLLAYSNGNKAIFPSTTNAYDLGSSSYQWNNLYAKNYYYNGTAWGLDKLNRWSKRQELRLAELEDYTLPSSEVATELFSWWGTTNFRGGFGHQYYTNGDEGCRFLLSSKDANNNDHLSAFRYKLNRAGTDSYFYGTGAQNFHLGTSTNKWKTFNGINPGALSLPNLANNGYIELSDNISANTEYTYTPAVDGWLALYVQTTGFHAENAVAIFNGSGSGSAYRWACSATSGINLARLDKYHGAVVLPVRAGVPYLCWIKIDSSTTLVAKMLYFYKAAGNV